MQIRSILTITFLLLSWSLSYGQKKFKVDVKETGTWKDIYSLVDEEGKIIRQLDTAEYYISFNDDQYGYFAVFGKKGSSGWTAIDANEKELFKVYNTSYGEPSPDYLVEKKIRIIDENGKIGFANEKGKIIISPQFAVVTSFYKNKAIIGEICQKAPWGEHEKETDCQHYSIVFGKYGYINSKGIVKKIGEYSFEQIRKEIDWKMPDE